MPINGLPSDEWLVKRALGPYAEPPDEMELKTMQELIEKKRRNKSKAQATSSESSYKKLKGE